MRNPALALLSGLVVTSLALADGCSTISDPAPTGGSGQGEESGRTGSSGRSGSTGRAGSTTGATGGSGEGSGTAGQTGSGGARPESGQTGGGGSTGRSGAGGGASGRNEPQDAGRDATADAAVDASDGGYVVALVQSTRANAADITQDDVLAMVTDAVDRAGGFGFVKDGQTVVLKPNLLTTSSGTGTLSPTVNGITTDWRVTWAVAKLVREKDPTGRIVVMEGSTMPTPQAYSTLGYTTTNFGTLVDDFVALEGASCNGKSTTGLVKMSAIGGKQYWANEQYVTADVLISIGALKTHAMAGITGAVKNLGIGATPASQYSASTSASDCTRDQNAANAGKASYVDHTRAGLGQFIHDFYSLRPADFAIIDGLQGMQHGPAPQWVAGGNYNNDKMNMRLVLASRNAVAADTVEALVMGCDPKSVDHLTKLEASGLGTTDSARIQIVGNKSIGEVQKKFAGPTFACNP